MSNQYNHTGIECTIGWFDDEDVTNYVLIMFDDNEDPGTEDDDKVFYYLNKSEQDLLYKYISESQNKFSVSDEWYIDLTDDYWFMTKEENNNA